MHISSKGDYGIRALFDLAQHDGAGPVQSRDIHQRQAIDDDYLNQILLSLRKAGLIESIRGPQGGHQLARPPAQITVLDALQALEGPLLPADAGRDTLMPAESIDRELIATYGTSCAPYWSAISPALRSTTLSSASGRYWARSMYYI